MKLGLIVILLFMMTLIPVTISDAYAKCIDRDNCPRPLGSSPLKEQIKQHTLVWDIKCMKQEHWLVERPNGKLACVTDSTAEKLGWYTHNYSMVDSKSDVIVTNGESHPIPFEITGVILEDLSYLNNSLIATIKPNTEYGVLSFVIKDELLKLNPEQCYTINNNTPSLSYVISVNGEEPKVGTSTNFSTERVLNVHTTQNAKTIEVVGICKN